MSELIPILHFTLGPVQGFVAQSRRTRDLWASSWLLSRLAGEGMLAALKADNDNQLILPRLTADEIQRLVNCEHACIPNRFALQSRNPALSGKMATEAILKLWKCLTDEVWHEFLESISEKNPATREIWRRQVDNFWEIAWASDPSGQDFTLLDRRKNWRTPTPANEPGDHCSLMPHLQELSGWNGGSRNNQKSFWESIRRQNSIGNLDLEDGEQLCSIAIIKRLFPKLGHSSTLHIPLNTRNWPSTLYLAAVPWLKIIQANPSVHALCADYAESAAQAKSAAFGERNSRIASIINSPSELGRFSELDANFYYPGALENERSTPLDREGGRSALLEQLNNLRKKVSETTGAETSPFYALLLMDGDRMGALLRDAQRAGKLQVATTALIDFARKVPEIVEAHDGRCVFAGGDDVLAMLPVDQGLSCASHLESVYRQAFSKLPEGLQGGATLSGALVFAHYKSTFSLLLREAHIYLDKIAKDRTGRASLAIAVQKGSGLACLYSAPWEFLKDESNNNITHLESLAKRMLREDRNDSVPENRFGKISGSFLYSLRDKISSLNGDSSRLDSPGHFLKLGFEMPLEDFILAEYLAGKSFDKEVEIAKAERAQACETVRQLIYFCHLVSREHNRKIVVHDGSRGSAVTFSLDGPLVARFISGGGKELER